VTNVKAVELRLAAPTPAPNTVYLIDDFFLATDTPILGVDPGAYAFPELLLGQSAQTTLLLTNAGTLGMTGTVRTVTNGYFTIVGSTNYILQAGATTNVTVQFSPSTAGSFSDRVFFLSDGGSFAVDVTGTGLTAPQLAVTPATVSLGNVVTGMTAVATFVATNSGGRRVDRHGGGGRRALLHRFRREFHPARPRVDQHRGAVQPDRRAGPTRAKSSSPATAET
jgi:hypothetical protein